MSAGQQAVQASVTIFCQGDSSLLEAVTNDSFTGWESVAGVRLPRNDFFEKSIWVKPDRPTDYVATASRVLAANLITNGNFETGNTGFTSAYTFSNFVNTGGLYSVDKNPNKHLNVYVPRGDHSTGAGNMLIMDGGKDSSQIVYSTVVMVDSSVEYVVGAWMANMHRIFVSNPDTNNWATAHFQLLIDDEVLGELQLPFDTSWHKFSARWKSSVSGYVKLDIKSKETDTQGNDFVIDDISIQGVQRFNYTVSNVLPCNKLAVFSPNGDGAFDTFFVEDSGWAKIFDLQGNLVSQFKAPAHWNGNHSDGREASSGYYAIVIDNQKIKHVSLIR